MRSRGVVTGSFTLSFIFIWSVGVSGRHGVVGGAGSLLSGGMFAGCGRCCLSRVKRCLLIMRSLFMRSSCCVCAVCIGDLSVVLVLVIVLIGLEVELVVSGGCGCV